ncbi:ATP-dependent RNA helicase [Sulfolobales archaeon HS-7]|nr:ATP-dependent RNA helicase [Sulfolobales archaeon HS-7]
MLSESIEKAIREMGFSGLTEVQQKVIPLLLSKKSVIVQSRTGSGKTAAYGIPIAQLKLNSLVLTPTRELARQVTWELSKISKYEGLRFATVYGGVGYAEQERKVKDADVIVGTPGRLLDLWGKGSLDLSVFRFVVVDEADVMLEMGFIDDVKEILHQTSMEIGGYFSATIPNQIFSLAKTFSKDAELVKIGDGEFDIANVEHRYYVTRGWTDKVKLLKSHIEDGTLVFTKTRDRAERLAGFMSNWYDVGELRGNMPQRVRERNIDGFRTGKYQVLIATDVASRGIDILSIKKVINFDMPDNKITYIHRIGRTGRLDRGGIAITYVEPSQLADYRNMMNSLYLRTIRAN